MKNSKYTRRSLLRGIGAGAVASGMPLFPLLEADAEAAGGSIKRLLLMWMPMGVLGVNENFMPNGENGNLQPKPHFKDLAPLMNRTIWIGGCNTRAVRQSGSNSTKSHTAMGSVMLTGTGNSGNEQSTRGTSKSVDIYLGEKIGADTAFPSLQFQVDSHFQTSIGVQSYSGPGQPVVAELDPVKAFSRVFAGVPSGGARPAAASGAPPVDFRAQKQRLIDNVYFDLKRLKARVSTVDQHRIDQHWEHLGAIESKLDKLATGSAGASEGCGGVPRPSGGNQDEVAKAYADIMPGVFACDLSRVITYQWSNWRVKFSFLGSPFSGTTHDYSHGADLGKFGLVMDWSIKNMAAIANNLASIKDADGSTLLDNTTMCYYSEFSQSHPSHDPNNIPILFIGGEKSFPAPRNRKYTFGDRSHSDWLATLCNCVGVQQEKFGAQCSGPIKEVAG